MTNPIGKTFRQIKYDRDLINIDHPGSTEVVNNDSRINVVITGAYVVVISYALVVETASWVAPLYINTETFGPFPIAR